MNRQTTSPDIAKTTRTTVATLLGPDCERRRDKVREIVTVYQLILYKVVAANLHKWRGSKIEEADIEDITGDEILLMLDPTKGYFKHYSPDKGRLRHWIKARIRNHTIDYLRKQSKQVEFDQKKAELESEIDSKIDEQEMFQLYRLALQLTEKHYSDQGKQEDFLAYIDMRKGQHASARVKDLSEWKKRRIKSEVNPYIEHNGIIAAALRVSDQPQDVIELAQSIWKQIKRRKTVDLNLAS